LVSIVRQVWKSEKIRYLFVGAYNTAFGYGVFVVLWYFFHHEIHYVTVLIISHFVSVSNAYIGYRIFVFQAKGQWFIEFVRFNMVYIGAFCFNLVSLPVLIESLDISPFIAQAGIVVTTVVSSYILHRRFSFKK
jgi:putative flippase GtrA